MSGRDWALLVGLSILWGGSFLFGKIAVGEWPALTVAHQRVLLAAATLALVLTLTGRRLPRNGAAWRAFFAMGLLNNVIPFSLIFWGQTQIASGLASILNATTPLFTVAVAHVLTRDEKLDAGKLAGVLLGIAGVAVLIGRLSFAAGPGHLPLGELACLAAALSYAFAGIYGRRFARMGLAPIEVAFGQLVASSAILTPLVLLIDAPWTLPLPSPKVAAAIVALAVFSTALAYIVFFRILASAGATNLALVTFLIPISAILLGALVLGETLLPRHFAGMALIACGLAAIDGRLPRLILRAG